MGLMGHVPLRRGECCVVRMCVPCLCWPKLFVSDLSEETCSFVGHHTHTAQHGQFKPAFKPDPALVSAMSHRLHTEGYTHAAPVAPAVRPAASVQNNPDSKQDRQFIVIGFTTFSHATPLHCAIRPLGTLFSFLTPPPPC